jgi:dethiobiotin synthetase/malonyl-CoA O-methyltransferase
VVSAALLYRLRGASSLRYWKPVQTGIETDDDTATVGALSGASPGELFTAGIRLPRPLSPHLSAARAGRSISIAEITGLVADQPASSRWIVEGAGGVLVPLNDRELMVDLMFMVGLPVVIVARSGLGTINHTLLTVEALRARAVPIAGVVMVGPRNHDNCVAIETYGHVAVVGELPQLEPLTPESLQRAAALLDPARALDVHLR